MTKVTVWLFIESKELTVDVMSNRIGLQSDVSWNKGDLRGKTGKVYSTNSWSLRQNVECSDGPEEVPKQINACIADILRRMSLREDAFRAVAAGGVSGLLVGIRAEDPPSIIFESAVLKDISSLGVDLEIDLVMTKSSKDGAA